MLPQYSQLRRYDFGVFASVLCDLIVATAFRREATFFGSLAKVSQLRRVAVCARARTGQMIVTTRAIHKRLILIFSLPGCQAHERRGHAGGNPYPAGSLSSVHSERGRWLGGSEESKRGTAGG